MTATDILAQMIRDGFTLTPEGQRIRVKPASLLAPDLKHAIQERRSQLLTILRRPAWNPTPEEEAKICRWIEKDKGLPAGSLRLYTPEEYRRRFGEKQQ